MNSDEPGRYRQRICELEHEIEELRQRLDEQKLHDSKSRELAMLKDVSNAIVSELDLQRVLQMVADKAREIIQAETVLVPMISKDCSEYRYVAASGANADAILYTRFPIHVGMCGWVLTNESPLLYGKDEVFALDETTHWEQGQTSALLVPLMGKNRIIGGLSALGKNGGGSFSKDDLNMIILFANQVSIAIENASLVEELRNTLDTLEQRVEERTAELTSMNRELESFCYSASHDLRSPLRGIDGYSQILLDDYKAALDEHATHYLQRIRSGSQRMGQIIDDLLRLSKIVRKTMCPERIDLTTLAGRINERYKTHMPEREAQVDIEPALSCTGDPELIEMALENFISNAWKFTQGSGKPHIQIGQNLDAGTPFFFIRDNGCGFDMQYKDKLFEPFQRLHADCDYTGTGVGLALAERIINRHGGQVWAISEPEQGATFMFTLPTGSAQPV